MVSRAKAQKHNEVTTTDHDIILVVLAGKQTAEGMAELGHNISRRVEMLHSRHKKALIMVDLRDLGATDTPSSARLESRRMFEIPADATAVIGYGTILTILMYTMRIAKVHPNMKLFTNRRKAEVWLKNTGRPVKVRSLVSLVGGIVVASMGLLTLIGYAVHNTVLIRGLPAFQATHPVAAASLLVVGYGFVCYYFGRLRQLKVTGVFGIALGLFVLLTTAAHAVLGTKGLLGASVVEANSAAICFLAVGLSPFTVGTKKPLIRLLQYLLGGLIIGLSLFNVYGQLYAYDFMYGVARGFVMSFNLALAFLVVGITLVLLVVYRHIGNVLGHVSRIGWLVVVSLVFVQIATYGAWAQVVTNNKMNSLDAFNSRSDSLDSNLDSRVQAYTDALYGFKGFFAASDYVDQGEFQTYYESLNLTATYPGLRSLIFISRVQEAALPAFVALHRQDKSLNAAGNPAFAITAKSNYQTHYILTYSASSSTPGGVDLGSNPSRLTAFQKAEKSRGPVSSGTVQFAASATRPAQTGFFITIPATGKMSQGANIGFVNAVFAYEDFFAHALSKPLLNGLAITVTDAVDGTAIYRSNDHVPAHETVLSRTISVPVVDRSWNLKLEAPIEFGLNESQRLLPLIVFMGGQLFALFLVVIFVLQARARRQGFALADNVTEDLERERNLAVADDQKRTAILASIGDAVLAIDTKRRITLFNPAAQRLSGFTETEALGKPYEEVVRFVLEASGRTSSHFINDALAGRFSSMAKHTVLIHKNGQRIPVADSAAPIRDANEVIQGAIVVFRDVTQDYQLDKAKSEFVSLASHQLRTPLSAINWYSEMLLAGDAGKLSTAQREYITEISEGNERMVGLVNSLLDVSRLELGRMVSEPAPTDIPQLINELEKELTSGILAKHLKFSKELQLIPLVMADPKQLRMVVQNLLSNAVKYTPEAGSVTVTLRKATAADVTAAGLKAHTPHWFFSVADTGYGIPQEQQSKIFGKLFRADNVRRLNVEGTGLGLYIVKEVVNKMGGQVWFESVEGKGTTFTAVLPHNNGKVKH